MLHIQHVMLHTTAWPVKYDIASNFLLPFFLVPFVPLPPSLHASLFLPSTAICRPTLTTPFVPTVEGSLVFVRISATALGLSPVLTGIHIISTNI
jgi:hypothetical protein